MSKIIFNEIQMKQLEKNKNALKMSECQISYCSDFKVRAVKENQQGKGPIQIFLENGFNLAVIGEEGFYTERRGKGSTYCVFRSGIDIPKKVRRTRKAGVTGKRKKTAYYGRSLFLGHKQRMQSATKNIGNKIISDSLFIKQVLNHRHVPI